MTTSNKLHTFYTLAMLLAGGAAMFLLITYSLSESVLPWQDSNGEFSFNRLCWTIIAVASLLVGWRRWKPNY